MEKKSIKIPKFKNDAQAADFWDAHDSTEYLSQTKNAHLDFPKPMHKIVINLEEKQWQKLMRLAYLRKLPYTRLVEKFIREKLAVGNR